MSNLQQNTVLQRFSFWNQEKEKKSLDSTLGINTIDSHLGVESELTPKCLESNSLLLLLLLLWNEEIAVSVNRADLDISQVQSILH